MQILIVDDEIVIRKGITKLLSEMKHVDCTIDEAKNGAEALEMINNKQPDILITDIQMPIMNGLDLVEKVRSLYSHIEIIILTGFAEFEYVQKALRNNVTDYLLKPISKVKLDEVISKILVKDPAKWITEMDFTNIQKVQETANILVKSVVAENKEGLKQVLKEWREFCNEKGFSLNQLKRMMGQMQLFYQSEFFQVLNIPPIGFTCSLNQNAATIDALFDSWLKYLLEQIDHISDQRTPKYKKIVEDALVYISANFHNNDLNVKKIADHCGITSAYLSTIFRKVMYQPITQYIIHFRLEKAKQMLKEDFKTNINIISEECGFNDYPYFSKVFKKIVGVSPYEYREKTI